METDFFSELGQELRDVWQYIRYSLHSFGVSMRNQLRQLRSMELDYIVMPLSGPFPERSGPPRSFIQRQLPLPPEPLSIEVLNSRLEAISDADNLKGVIFTLQGISTGLATILSIRALIKRLSQSGKKTVVFTPYLDMAHYLIATAADKIVVPPGATFEVVGIRSEAIFLKEAMGKLGIEADVIQISPYKTAYDLFSKDQISAEQEEQLNWILDDVYDLVTFNMAEGRGRNQDEMRAFINKAPLTAEQTLEAGLVDHVDYEDRLPFLLADGVVKKEASELGESDGQKERETAPKARLVSWSAGREILKEKPRRPRNEFIGVISLEGSIVMGPSRQPPIEVPIPLPLAGGPAAGEQTLIQQLRRAERESRMAALILHVDSGGGSALASDMIWRQINRIAKKKPVVAYMGNTAASGGYYVCAPAAHIVAQPATITGSIGVVMLHLSTGGLYEKLGVNRVSLNRGDRAKLFSDVSPLNSEERQVLWDSLLDSYNKFKNIITDGRAIPLADLDPICEGRVWTGRQALDHKLIDGHGDFTTAVEKAAELAQLPINAHYYVPVRNIYPDSREYLLPKPFSTEELIRIFSAEHLLKHIGRPLLLMPYTIHFR